MRVNTEERARGESVDDAAHPPLRQVGYRGIYLERAGEGYMGERKREWETSSMEQSKA
jgi:hypothetical protein